MTPVLDQAVLDVLKLSSPESADAQKMFLTAPVRWIDGPEGDLVALGVGSLNGVQRRETVATMHAHAAQNAFQPPGTPGPQYRSEFFLTQDSGVQSQVPHISATQNPAGENGAILDSAKPPTSMNGGIESTQPVPITARDENVPPDYRE